MRPANLIPKIFIGLGNPGDRYQHTRHNLGYLSIDSFMERHQLEDLKDDKKSDGSLLKSELYDKEKAYYHMVRTERGDEAKREAKSNLKSAIVF